MSLLKVVHQLEVETNLLSFASWPPRTNIQTRYDNNNVFTHIICHKTSNNNSIQSQLSRLVFQMDVRATRSETQIIVVFDDNPFLAVLLEALLETANLLQMYDRGGYLDSKGYVQNAF